MLDKVYAHGTLLIINRSTSTRWRKSATSSPVALRSWFSIRRHRIREANCFNNRAIKYKRMKDKFGTASAAANTQTANDDEEDGASEETSKPKKKAHAKKTASKKRKLNEDNEEEAKVKAEEDD